MTETATVIFMPSGKRGRVEVGTPVLTAARQLGVDLDSVCGGRGICSKCQVMPGEGEFPKHGLTVTADALSEWNAVEERYKSKRGMIDGRRLGCQARIEGDIVIDVPPESQVHKQVVRKDAQVRDIPLNPAVRLFTVDVEEPDMHEPSGDAERLVSALENQHGVVDAQVGLGILQSLQPTLRTGSWTVTCAVHLGPMAQVMQVWPGVFEGPLHGIAIDLGSTTIAGHVCDLATGEVLASSGLMNPQIRFGEDLMSRVSYAMMNQGGDAEMTSAVQEGVNQLVGELAQEAGIERGSIMDLVIVCNPVMHHLLIGVDPFELGQAPFALATSEALNVPARDIGIHAHPLAQTYLLPCIAGHVGADAAAVTLSESPETSDDLVLVVDVGTNAEIQLGDKDGGVLACSSPTGPAFEGAQISSGQRAAPGAIERVEIDPVTKDPRFRVIGVDLWSDDPDFAAQIAGTGVTGICGSGIIEMIAEMRLAGIVDASGLIGSPEQTGTDRCFLDGRTYSYRVSDANPDDGSREIVITNQDVREIQMAKAALYAGARLLMDKRCVDTVDRVVLAGAFGAHISPKHAMVLGMIPDCAMDKVTSAGNAAGTGARIALLDRTSRDRIEAIVRDVQKIETAIEPRFQEHFVNASAMPNAVDPFPHLSGIVTLPDVSFNSGSGDTGTRRRRRRAS